VDGGENTAMVEKVDLKPASLVNPLNELVREEDGEENLWRREKNIEKKEKFEAVEAKIDKF
jgi:hypothetical protein